MIFFASHFSVSRKDPGKPIAMDKISAERRMGSKGIRKGIEKSLGCVVHILPTPKRNVGVMSYKMHKKEKRVKRQLEGKGKKGRG